MNLAELRLKYLKKWARDVWTCGLVVADTRHDAAIRQLVRKVAHRV